MESRSVSRRSSRQVKKESNAICKHSGGFYRKVSRFHKRNSLTNSTRSSMVGHCIIERSYPNSNLRRATTSW